MQQRRFADSSIKDQLHAQPLLTHRSRIYYLWTCPLAAQGKTKKIWSLKGEDKEGLFFRSRPLKLFLWHLPLQTLHHPCSPPLGANYYFTSFLHHRAPACTQSSRWDCSRGGSVGQSLPSTDWAWTWLAQRLRLNNLLDKPSVMMSKASPVTYSPETKHCHGVEKSMLLEIWRLAKHTTVSWNTTVICGYAAVTFQAASANWETFCNYHIYIISRILANH